MVKTTYEALDAFGKATKDMSFVKTNPISTKARDALRDLKVHTRDVQIISFLVQFRDCLVGGSRKDPQKLLSVFDDQPLVVQFIFQCGFAEYIHYLTDTGIVMSACREGAVNILRHILRSPEWSRIALAADTLSAAMFFRETSDETIKVFLEEAPAELFKYAKAYSMDTEATDRDARLYEMIVDRFLTKDNLPLFRDLVRKGMTMEAATGFFDWIDPIELVWLKTPQDGNYEHVFYAHIADTRKAYDKLYDANQTNMLGMDMLGLENSLLGLFQHAKDQQTSIVTRINGYMAEIARLKSHMDVRSYMTAEWMNPQLANNESARGALVFLGISYLFDNNGEDIVAYTMQTNEVAGVRRLLDHPKYGPTLDRHISPKSLVPVNTTKLSTMQLFIENEHCKWSSYESVIGDILVRLYAAHRGLFMRCLARVETFEVPDELRRLVLRAHDDEVMFLFMRRNLLPGGFDNLLYLHALRYNMTNTALYLTMKYNPPVPVGLYLGPSIKAFHAWKMMRRRTWCSGFADDVLRCILSTHEKK